MSAVLLKCRLFESSPTDSVARQLIVYFQELLNLHIPHTGILLQVC